MIVGYGLPGRSVAEALHGRGVSFCVIELNPAVVARCTLGGVHMIHGDARDPAVLRSAGIEQALIVAVCVPSDEAAVGIIEAARAINPDIQIVARANFTSSGLRAFRAGADGVVVAEQCVAFECARQVTAA